MSKFMLPCIVVLLFVGCTKPPDYHVPTTCNCKLLSMVDTVSQFTFTYQYDSHNRLEYRTGSYGGHTAPDFKVIYDPQGRVSSYIFTDVGNYNVGSSFFEWHFVNYDNRGNIVLDTVYYDGRIGANGPEYDPGFPVEYFRYTITYEYDVEKRMIARHSGMAGDETYIYNADGNLTANQFGDPLTYDDKVNWNRTDPFLQFIDRDYSKNNPVGAGSYNKYGLPLEYPRPADGSWSLIIGHLNFFDPKFNYSCK